MTKLSAREIAERAPQGWVLLAGALRTRLRTGSFAAGLELVNAIGAAAEAADHHPDLDLRYSHLDITLSSHDVGAVTGRDLRLAATVSELASAAGVTAEPAAVVGLELALDTPEPARVLPFWQAVLGLARHTDQYGEYLRDPSGVLPAVWFQKSGDPRTSGESQGADDTQNAADPQNAADSESAGDLQNAGEQRPGQRWHPDLWVDPAQVRPRIAAALAAGGSLVSDAAAPSFWVLADPDGNRVCLCTWQSRDGQDGEPYRS